MTAARYDWSPLRAGDVHAVTFSFVDGDGVAVSMGGTYAAEIRDDWYPDGDLVALPEVTVDTSTITLVLTAEQTATIGALKLRRFPFTLRDELGETTIVEGYVTVRTQGGTAPAGVSVVVRTEPVIQIVSPAVPIGSRGPAGVDGVDGADGDIVNGGGVSTIQALSQSEYDALSPPDASTLYVVTS